MEIMTKTHATQFSRVRCTCPQSADRVLVAGVGGALQGISVSAPAVRTLKTIDDVAYFRTGGPPV